ncbi:MAG: SDR family NAD(P)-dependent oxidoreductase [Alphaproteobacteria bacterium]|nr:SDR family NAD(P)-dependent oxidoreductase [Alphaproteobacteria bacterium]
MIDAKTAIVFGAGAGLGGTVARRFAKAGYSVALVARDGKRLGQMAAEIGASGGRAIAIAADTREEIAVETAFVRAESEMGPVGVAVYNPGAMFRGSLLDTDAETFKKVWRLTCFGGFLVGRAAAKRMVERGHGTILFSGATASVRGGALYSAFASAKAGLRSLSQSMAREFGPKGIHVAHIVIDGVIDTAAVRERLPGRIEALPPNGAMKPDDIAEAYWQLHAQPRSAWTHELDLRPWCEKF